MTRQKLSPIHIKTIDFDDDNRLRRGKGEDRTKGWLRGGGKATKDTKKQKSKRQTNDVGEATTKHTRAGHHHGASLSSGSTKTTLLLWSFVADEGLWEAEAEDEGWIGDDDVEDVESMLEDDDFD
jgi:hypothetical protein